LQLQETKRSLGSIPDTQLRKEKTKLFDENEASAKKTVLAHGKQQNQSEKTETTNAASVGGRGVEMSIFRRCDKL